MSVMNVRFAGAVAAVSAGAALAAATLVEGSSDGRWPLLVAGVALGIVSLLGIVALARAVILDQRRDGRR